MCTSIGSYAFRNCNKLTSIYLLASSVCTLYNSSVFYIAGITSTQGSIFVPSSLVTSYKTATNWTYFSNRIFGYDQSSDGSDNGDNGDNGDGSGGELEEGIIPPF